jgi:hypothetical protein
MQVSKAHAKQTEILADYPAYSIYKPATNFRGDVFVTQNEYIRLPFNSRTHGIQWHEFKVSSVAGYAIENNDDPIAAHEKAVKSGHATHFLIGCGVTISNRDEGKRHYYGHQFGDVVYFAGKRFRIEPDHNQNAKFVPHE